LAPRQDEFVSGRVFEFRRDLFQYRPERIGAGNPDFVAPTEMLAAGIMADANMAVAILLGVRWSHEGTVNPPRVWSRKGIFDHRARSPHWDCSI
jgi:hypothetical protein